MNSEHPLTLQGAEKFSPQNIGSSFPPEIRAASGLKKLDWVLSLEAPEALIQGLMPQEFYFWMKDIGKSDAYPLLEYASQEQIRALVDLDAWIRRDFSVERFMGWLDLALSANLDTALHFLRAQDETVLEMLFTGEVTVHPSDTDIDLIPDELAVLTSPDGMYILTVPREHPLEESLPQLMKLLWAADMGKARLVFQQVQFELRSQVEFETARFRDARLQDLGFESYDEALSVFEVLPLAPLKEELEKAKESKANEMDAEGEGGDALPLEGDKERGLSLLDERLPSLLQEALGLLSEEAYASFMRKLIYLSNKVFVAETGDIGRIEDYEDYAHYAFGLVNLGLSELSQEHPPKAALALETFGAEILFKAGWTQVFALSRRARRLATRAGLDLGFALFGSPLDDALYAAHLVRPLFPTRLDGEDSELNRPIKSSQDLHLLRSYLTEIESLLAVFEERFGVTRDSLVALEVLDISSERRRRIQLTTLIRTGLAQALLTDEFSFKPLGRDDIVAFSKAAFDAKGHLSPLLTSLLLPFQNTKDALSALVTKALDELVSSMGKAVVIDGEEQLDLRYLGELFLLNKEADEGA